MKRLSLRQLETRIASRARRRPKISRTVALLDKGLSKCLQKYGEEAVELVIAVMESDRKMIIGETADALYHLLIVLHACGITLKEIERELWLRSIQKTGNPKADRRGT